MNHLGHRKAGVGCCSPLRRQTDYGEQNALPQNFTDDELKELSRKVASMFIGRVVKASIPEKEVERLLLKLLPGSPFYKHAFAAGGFVRDELMGIDSKDLDIVVDFEGGSEKFCRWIHDRLPSETSTPHQIGAGYPIWSISFKEDVFLNGVHYETQGAVIEVADSQKESFPDEESRQRLTTPGTLGDDVLRRDFSVNSIMKDLSTSEIIDLTGVGISDLKNGILRGNPGVDFDKILREDPLRMIRLLRFQVKYGWKVPMSVLRIVKKNAQRITIVSSERIRAELEKIMKLGKMYQAVKFMKATGLLQYVLPEINDMIDVMHDTSRGFHQEGSVYNHVLLVLKNAKPGIENQLAALLHDVGKPATRKLIGDKIQFLGHEDVGAEMAEAIMRRLKFDLDTTKRVKKLVALHMRPHSLSDDDASPKALRRFIRDVGDELMESLLDLAEADTLGNLPPENYVPGLRDKIKESLKVPMKKKPLLNGLEIMNILGIKTGPQVGVVTKFLSDLEDQWAAEGKVLSKEEATEIVLKEFA